jgi:hypothetical protein
VASHVGKARQKSSRRYARSYRGACGRI